MKQAPEHLVNIIQPIVEGLGYECWGIEFNAHPQHGLLRVYIDKAEGILIDDCSKVSHQLSGVLDVEDPIPGNYNLEVSSPGADRPFFKAQQFERFIGETVTLNLFTPINKQRKITGIIHQTHKDSLRLQVADAELDIPFQAISKARLVPDFFIKKGVRNGK
jgi:ribosome maturation factor RimP